MSWTNRQKGLVHAYAQAADLSERDYRTVLHEVSGCSSAKDAPLTQYHFDTLMARFEGILWSRIEEGIVPRPSSRKITNLHYWRRRCPTGGHQNSRQSHAVRELWDQLQPYLPEADRTDAYLCSIASRACGYRVKSRWDLLAWQAGLLIDALRDRLQYAVRGRTAA